MSQRFSQSDHQVCAKDVLDRWRSYPPNRLSGRRVRLLQQLGLRLLAVREGSWPKTCPNKDFCFQMCFFGQHRSRHHRYTSGRFSFVLSYKKLLGFCRFQSFSKYHVCCFFCDHHDGCIGVARRHFRHNRGIRNSQALKAAHAKLAVYDCT